MHEKLFDVFRRLRRHTGTQTDRHMDAQTYRYEVLYPPFSVYARSARKQNELVLAEAVLILGFGLHWKQFSTGDDLLPQDVPRMVARRGYRVCCVAGHGRRSAGRQRTLLVHGRCDVHILIPRSGLSTFRLRVAATCEVACRANSILCFHSASCLTGEGEGDWRVAVFLTGKRGGRGSYFFTSVYVWGGEADDRFPRVGGHFGGASWIAP